MYTIVGLAKRGKKYSNQEPFILSILTVQEVGNITKTLGSSAGYYFEEEEKQYFQY